jgi:predicted ABC-type ATPase
VEPRPSVIVLAGPNGAGKSTAAAVLFREVIAVSDFVNADVIAAEQSPSDPASVAVGAGREMLVRLHDLARRRQSFGFETTLASRTFARWLDGLVETGYSLHILFLWLPSPEFAVARVESRVRAGGHNVPEAIVRRRYTRGLRNFFDLYQPLATSWRMYDTSVGREPRLIAAGHGRTTTLLSDPETWERIRRGAHANE